MPVEGRESFETRLRKRALIVLTGGLFLVLAQAAVPLEEFVHRGDDAFYYFQLAASYQEVGFWSFDSIESTNGVQPLWALLLTAIAVPLDWIGVDDPQALARVFVGVTALLHFGSALVLFQLLSRKVSLGTGLAVAGAFLFPLGIVWARVWGMENSLYALLLVSTIAFFHLRFLRERSVGFAVVLGVLLGLTALARLNAGLLIPVLLVFYLARAAYGPFRQRLRLGLVTAAAASLVLVPYFAWNYLETDHLLPVSGEVKRVESRVWLDKHGVETRASGEFLSTLYEQGREPIASFIKSRAADGLWLVGGRAVFDGAPRMPRLLAVLALVALLPLLARRPAEWWRFLRERFARLSPFAYVLAFALLNAALSVVLYPDEIGYAVIRWWLVESEIVIVVLVATLVAASVAYLGSRWVPRWPQRLGLATAALAVLLAFHAQDAIRFYFDDKVEYRDWNKSWNDESYRAARWLERNAPRDALVGSWNAGVLGYYSRQRVVNLDGLVNNFELLPYLEERRIGDYIRRRRLSYLSDLGPMFELKKHELTRLRLREVYSHYSNFARQHYRIYKVARG